MTAPVQVPLQQLPRFVAAGEALTDMIRAADGSWASKVGGATWNVARVVGKLGIYSAFAGGISCDVFGDALWTASALSGLDLRFIQRLAKSPLLAFVPETHPPRYFFVGDDSADLHFDAATLPTGWQQQVQWAHFGGISLAREPLAGKLLALATELKAAGVKISYDPNFRVTMDERYDATLRQMSALADVIKVSDDDLVGLFRSGDIDKSLDVVRNWNSRAVILYTRGAAGATLHVGQQTWHSSAPKIDVVDTVGAGDASIGGLLFSLMQYPQRDWPAHLRFAVCAGAGACLAAGAAPPSLQIITDLFSA
jgi:fructokinase